MQGLNDKHDVYMANNMKQNKKSTFMKSSVSEWSPIEFDDAGLNVKSNTLKHFLNIFLINFVFRINTI